MNSIRILNKVVDGSSEVGMTNLKPGTRNILKTILLLFFCFLFNTKVSSQANLPPGTYSSTNKKAIKHFEESQALFKARKDEDAEKAVLKALKEDDNFIEAHSGYGDYLMSKGRAKEAIPHYEKAIQVNPKIFLDNNFYLGGAYLTIGEYEKAIGPFKTFLKAERVNPAMKEYAQSSLKNAEFGANAVKNPKPFNLVNVGGGINTGFDEYFPSVTGDGKYFMFTRNLDSTHNQQLAMEDFYIAKNLGKEWSEAIPMNGVNTTCNEGAPSIGADGTFMFFASCPDQMCSSGDKPMKNFGHCDIFYSQKVNGKWTRPVNIGPPVNTANWESQPSFSSDGKTLYFIRGKVGRDGRINEEDIFMSTIQPDGKFGTPVKLSDKINTPLQEESVFIHPDNQTLYFSSEGHPGMGGLDIYMSRRQPDGSWGEAINLGYPINTSQNENSLLVDPSGRLAYFASSRPGGFGGLDVYQFELPEDVRPQKITYVKGKTYNARTKEAVSAKFELIDLETQQSVTESYSDNAGQFLVTLTGNKNYIVNVAKDGFLFYSDNFSLKGKETDFNKPFVLDIPLQPIDTGSTVELKNVFFDVDKWELKPESKAELDKLIFFLTKNPSVKIELGGHTDNSGKKEWNKTLSTNRAKAVYDYVITNGKIPAARLSFKGYAETKPKVPNDTPENKAKNRRTEFKVTAK